MADNENVISQWITNLPGNRIREGELGGQDGCQRAGSLKTKMLVILLFLGDINSKGQGAMGMQDLEITII